MSDVLYIILQLLDYFTTRTKHVGGAKNELYDIGTNILFVQCFVTTDVFLLCKPIFFSGNCRICRDLAFGSVNTRFKAILKKLDFSAQVDSLKLFGRCPKFQNSRNKG